MDRTGLEQMLWRYNSDKARAEYLRRYIPLMEKKLARLREEALQSIGCAPPPDTVTGGRTGDPTAVFALRAVEEALSDEMRVCRNQLRRLRIECAGLEAQNELTECLLSSLTEESRFLLTERYIEHRRWQDLPGRYQERFGVYYSLITLRRRAAQALDTLCRTGAAAG